MEEFWKIQPRYLVLHVALGILKRNVSPRFVWRIPKDIAEKRPFLFKLGRFSAISLGLCHTERGLTFLFRIPQATCRTRDLRWCFSKFLCGAELRRYPYGMLTPRSSRNRERLRKKGGGVHFPPKYSLYLYLKYDGYYDFAIKHDLIPWSDQVLGVQHWLKTRWGPKISTYVTLVLWLGWLMHL